MAIAYNEFDQVTTTIVAGIKEKILASSDWAHLQLTTGTQATTLSSAASAGATSISTAATIPSGSYIVVGSGAATPEVRLTTGVTGSGPYTVSWSAAEPLVRSYGSGAAVGVGTYVKATTTRGAQMVLDLATSAPGTQNLTMQAFAGHDGTTAVGPSGSRWLYWKRSGGVGTNVLHCRVTAHKDGLYFDVEGPRASETGADSTYGSFRSFYFMGDVAPYDSVGDTTPVVLMAASAANGSDNSQRVWVSKNKAANSFWVPALLRTLAYPQYNLAQQVGNNPTNAANGDYVQGPWVVFEAMDGIRGRLQYLHFGGLAGLTPDMVANEPAAPIPGSEMIYGSFRYKAMLPFRTDGAQGWMMSYSVGCIRNYDGNNFLASPVLWVPWAVYP